MATENDALGGRNDSVRIEIDGKTVLIVEQYTVELSILRQPGAMSFRIGSHQTAVDLIATVIPRKSRYKLFIRDVLTQSGIIYAVDVPDSDSTVVEITGRDFMSVVHDAYVLEEKTFHEKTYREWVRRILDELGLTEAKGHKLITSNDTNRLKLTGRNVTATSHTIDSPSQPKTKTTKELRDEKAAALVKERFGIKVTNLTVNKTPDLQRAGFDPANQVLIAGKLGLVTVTPSAIVEQQKIDSLKTSAAGGTSEVIVQTLKVQLGWRWVDVLEREFKLAGLFLWCDADGNFILARPNANQAPSYRLFRERNTDRLGTNIEKARYRNDTTQRHTRAVCYGQNGKGKAGRNKLRGEWIDDELADSDFDAPITIHDRDVATNAQAKYLARKMIAEERRSGWTLVYTVTGHVTGLISAADGASTNWAVDTVIDVDDRELGIQRRFYLEQVKFSRAPVQTELTLMREEDLVFAEDAFPAPIKVHRQIPKQADSGVDAPATNEPDDQAAE